MSPLISFCISQMFCIYSAPYLLSLFSSVRYTHTLLNVDSRTRISWMHHKVCTRIHRTTLSAVEYPPFRDLLDEQQFKTNKFNTQLELVRQWESVVLWIQTRDESGFNISACKFLNIYHSTQKLWNSCTTKH